jgi:hypothetical protein
MNVRRASMVKRKAGDIRARTSCQAGPDPCGKGQTAEALAFKDARIGTTRGDYTLTRPCAFRRMRGFPSSVKGSPCMRS